GNQRGRPSRWRQACAPHGSQRKAHEVPRALAYLSLRAQARELGTEDALGGRGRQLGSATWRGDLSRGQHSPDHRSSAPKALCEDAGNVVADRAASLDARISDQAVYQPANRSEIVGIKKCARKCEFSD